MKVDFDLFDGMAVVVADKRKGLWATSILLRGSRTVRTAGRTPTTEASHQTLLTIALSNALRIPKREREKLLSTATTQITKPRLLVISDSSDFVSALSAGIYASETSSDARPLQAGREFKRQLNILATKFRLTFQHDGDEFGTCFSLATWMGNVLKHPHDVQFLPPIMQRLAISQIAA